MKATSGAFFLIILLCSVATAATTAGPAVSPDPSIESLVKPEVWKRVHEDRDVRSYSSLDGNHYSFYAVMIADAPLKRTHEILTDYRLYAKMIPYIQQADFDPATQNLRLHGGIWKFYLTSTIHFTTKSATLVHFDVIQGHFQGLSGDIRFEKMPDRGTAVLLKGEQNGTHWPPKLILERGAEIVFEFTAKRMRSYVESGDAR
jgi:hypothetical protein